MEVNDHVSLTDPAQTHHGKVTAVAEDGMCHVKWDSGMTERVHESELTRIYVTEGGKVLTDADVEELSREAEQGYESEVWDSRER